VLGRIFERPAGRYKIRSIPAAIAVLEKNAANLEIHERYYLERSLKNGVGQGISWRLYQTSISPCRRWYCCPQSSKSDWSTPVHYFPRSLSARRHEDFSRSGSNHFRLPRGVGKSPRTL